MGGIMRELKVSITVRSGVDDDEVVEELGEVIDAAVTAWYESKGREVLACDPT